MKLEVRHAACGYGETLVLGGVSLEFESGEVVCLLGPNGVGKTTLFKSIMGFLKLLDGEILLDGKQMAKLSKKYIAQNIGYVPQAHAPPFPFKVLDVVVMGRTAHISPCASPSANDMDLARNTLEELNIGHLRNKAYTEISGGERQLVLIARALVQQPQLLIMDEPTSNLDFGNQVRVLEVIRRLSLKGLGVLMTSHFPDHAFLCCNKVFLLRNKLPILQGSVEEIVTEENLRAAYGVKVKIAYTNDDDGKPVKACIPILNSD
jgi:iron complex transport system ATP-binding protein